jgi:hypothetical protein
MLEIAVKLFAEVHSNFPNVADYIIVTHKGPPPCKNFVKAMGHKCIIQLRQQII